MQIDDLEQVMPIETENFSVPWTKTGFFTFLIREDAIFLVAEDDQEILGYCGVLTVLDEGDITNVAVRKRQTGRGYREAACAGADQKSFRCRGYHHPSGSAREQYSGDQAV